MSGLKHFSDRVAVVTGASSGIGAEIAAQLVQKGMRVALVSRRRDRLEALASKLAEGGSVVTVHPCDIADRDAVDSCAGDIKDLYGRIDLLVNCAGYVRHILFKDHPLEDIEQMMKTNYFGTVYWIKQALPLMRDRGEGWIVNFSSFAGLVSQPDEAAYTATKFAITGLSEALACEFAPLGIHVMCVYPVLVETEMFTPEVMARMPKETNKRFMPADKFVNFMLNALERGEHHVILPRGYRGVVILKNLFPGMMSRKISEVILKVLKDITS